MNVSRSSVAILILGALSLLFPQILSDILIPQRLADEFFVRHIWRYIGAIYLVTAVSYEVRNLVSFRYAVGVAVASVLIPVSHRLMSLSTARPELAPPELVALVFNQKFVLISLVVALMAPMGRARKHTERLAVLVAIIIPFVVTVIRMGSQGFGFFFNLSLLALMFSTGVAVGLPLFLYALAYGPESSISDMDMANPD